MHLLNLSAVKVYISMTELKILFVCLGNKCRSPMAEAIMKQSLAKRQLIWTVDSAGLRDWNIGSLPNERTIKVLRDNGLKSKHIGRKITPSDFNRFDYILVMDELNRREVLSIAESLNEPVKSKIELLGSYAGGEDKIIEDPYFSSESKAFQETFRKISECCNRFIAARIEDLTVSA